MKKNELNIKKYIMPAVVGVLALGTIGLMAQNYMSMPVAVVDVERVQKEAKPFKIIHQEAEKYVSALTARMQDDEKSVQVDVSVLQKEIDKNKGKKYDQEIANLNTKITELRQKYQAQSNLVMRMTQKAMDDMSGDVNKVLEQVANDKNIDVILPKKTVTFNAKCVDVTDAIILAIDKADIKPVYPDPKEFVNQITQK